MILFSLYLTNEFFKFREKDCYFCTFVLFVIIWNSAHLYFTKDEENQ